MNAQRGRLVSGGRLQVPAAFRQAMGVTDGDALIMELVDNELRIRPLGDALARVRQRLAPYVPNGVLLSDELIADRRTAAADE